MQERIQKIISSSGLMSRRAAEELIKSGKVLINGNIAAIGQKADIEFDSIIVNGKKIKKTCRFVYIILNKPQGYVTTLKDEKGRHCISELIGDVKERVYPVGRLDMFSEGLLFLTNDGDLAKKIIHPSSQIKKIYIVHVKGGDINSHLKGLGEPIEIDGRYTSGAKIVLLERKGNDAFIEVTISEGRNRQIRRLCEREGLKVVELRRISEAGIELGDLPVGKWRYLTDVEICRIK